MAHFKPFARAKTVAPSHRCSSSRRDRSEEDSTYREYRRYKRYGRNGGLLGGLLGL